MKYMSSCQKRKLPLKVRLKVYKEDDRNFFPVGFEHKVLIFFLICINVAAD